MCCTGGVLDGLVLAIRRENHPERSAPFAPDGVFELVLEFSKSASALAFLLVLHVQRYWVNDAGWIVAQRYLFHIGYGFVEPFLLHGHERFRFAEDANYEPNRR